MALPSLFLLVWITRWVLRSTASHYDAVACLVISFVWAAGRASFTLHSILLCLPMLALLACFVLCWRLPASPKVQSQDQADASKRSPFRPLILPCRTSHARLFPKKHSFSYSYLQVGVPVGWKGRVASIVGTDLDTQKDPGSHRWSPMFRVEAGDHLDRGNDQEGLKGKLAGYLKDQVSTSSPDVS